MNLGNFFETFREDPEAELLVRGDASREVSGVSVEEPLRGWLAKGNAAVTRRRDLDETFLREVAAAGSPGVVWRSGSGRAALEAAKKLGLGVLRVSPAVPLGNLLSALYGGNPASDGLLLLSHRVGRELLEDGEEERSLTEVTRRVARTLGRPVVLEDAVGRVIGASPDGAGEVSPEGGSLLSILRENSLRASQPSGVEETRRERRDRYARLPEGFLSVPVERWRVAGTELHWSPVGGNVPAGYLWMDLRDGPLTPEDVVRLYWARRALKTELDKDRIRLETELGVRGDFVDDLINGHYGSVELLLQRARYLGADLSEGALVLIVDIDDFARYLERRRLKEPAIQELKRRLADAVRLQTRQLFSNFLTGPRSDNVILLLAPSENEPRAQLPEKTRLLASRLQRYVRGLLPDLTVSVGVGRFKEDPADLPAAYSEADVALDIGHRIHGPSSVSTFEEIGTYKLLFKVLRDDPEELETFYEETLGAVVAYDERYGTELVHTLMTYLLNDASTVRTAAELFAHRHTIRYRLDRIGELTNLDVERSEDREKLTLGIKAMQLLGRAPGRPSSFTDR